MAHVWHSAAGWMQEIRQAWALHDLRHGALEPPESGRQRAQRCPGRLAPLLVVRHAARDVSMQTLVLQRLAPDHSGVDVIMHSSVQLVVDDARVQWETAARSAGLPLGVRVTDWTDEARAKRSLRREIRIWPAKHLSPTGGKRMLLHDIVVAEEVQAWRAQDLRALADVTCCALVAGLPVEAPRQTIGRIEHVLSWAPRTRRRLLRELRLHASQDGSHGAMDASRRATQLVIHPASPAARGPSPAALKLWLGRMAEVALVAARDACWPSKGRRLETWRAFRHGREYAEHHSAELGLWVYQLLCCALRATVAYLARVDEADTLRSVLREVGATLCPSCRTPLPTPGCDHACLGEPLPFAARVLREAESEEIAAEMAMLTALRDERAHRREVDFCRAALSQKRLPIMAAVPTATHAAGVLRVLMGTWQGVPALADWDETSLFHAAVRSAPPRGYAVWLAGARSIHRCMGANANGWIEGTARVRPWGFVARRDAGGGGAPVACDPASAGMLLSDLGAYRAFCRNVRRPSNAHTLCAAALPVAETAVCACLGGGCTLAGTSAVVTRWSFLRDIRHVWVAPSFLTSGGAGGVVCLRRLHELWPHATCCLQSAVGSPWTRALEDLLQAVSGVPADP